MSTHTQAAQQRSAHGHPTQRMVIETQHLHAQTKETARAILPADHFAR
jgi:hypothetical protein